MQSSAPALVTGVPFLGLLASMAVVWLLSDGIYPTVEATIENLPEMGSLHGGQLDWRDDSPLLGHLQALVEAKLFEPRHQLASLRLSGLRHGQRV